MNHNTDLIQKWESVLDDSNFLPIENHEKRYALAQVLENTNMEVGRTMQARGLKHKPANLIESYQLNEASPTNVMGASSSTAGAGPIDIYDPVLIGMLRRTMPNLMAYDFMGVQPMTGPSGTIFAMRGRYGDQSGSELFYTEANGSWTATAAGNSAHTSSNSEFIAQVGSDPSILATGNTTGYTFTQAFSTAFAELLGKDTGNEFPEVGLTIDKVDVKARSRALKATYSVELAQDMMAIHGLNAEQQITNYLTNEIMFEINREMIRTVYVTATGGAINCAATGVFNMDIDADGRWLGEKILGLMLQLDFEANQVAKSTRFGKANLMLCSSNVASALNAAKKLHYSPELAAKLQVDDTGQTFAGVLDTGMKVYIDPYHSSADNTQFACVGYKGTTSAWDSGLFYCPYVPLQYMKAVDSKSFQPAVAFKTRYGVVANPFATSAGDGVISVSNKNRYYRLFGIKNLL